MSLSTPQDDTTCTIDTGTDLPCLWHKPTSSSSPRKKCACAHVHHAQCCAVGQSWEGKLCSCASFRAWLNLQQVHRKDG